MTRSRLLQMLSNSSFAGLFAFIVPTAVVALAPTEAVAAETGQISGVIRNSKSKARISDAIVILQCSCLEGSQRETRPNSSGLYAFRDLPAGAYTVQVIAGQADVSKKFTLPRGGKFTASFSLDPENTEVRTIVVRPPVSKDQTTVATRLTGEEMKKMPVGDSSRDFTAAVEASATSKREAGGYSIAGTTAAESKYTVNGASVNDPSFGTVGASIVQEFISDVEVLESGYDAEYGGATGGQVRARLISGSNTVRGQARFTVTPRLARPRFIIATDNAVRATETPDYLLQGVVQASGPIIKDKLFWSIGANVSGGRGTLTQSFHRRVDKDESGGFEDCPYKNGDNDCVDGGDYIATEEFDSQKFRLGGVNAGYFAQIDWVINPKHRLFASVLGGPTFTRRSFRRPSGFSTDPSAFGTTQNADPLGGSSNVASGVVNDHFGWDRDNGTSVSLRYLGRVADDKLEIDAGLSYSEFRQFDAWRLDNPEFYDLTATEQRDTQGENLFKLLDRDGRLDLVDGVSEACNDTGIPGLSCPVRRWVSGGVGKYGRSSSRQISGDVSLTHFFNGWGAHQLKYGTEIAHTERRVISRYSGFNESDFYDNCPNGIGGGEWCYDPEMDAYDTNNGVRVDNHRIVIVDTDNPDNRFTQGYGRVRKEQGQLRAIASPAGAGVRVPEYNEKTSTQNYGIYLQDRWAILSNLSVSAGVRWEIQDMRDIMGERAVFIWDNVAPRIGLVYDWTDEGKSRLFASYGWFYQPLPLQLNSRVFGGLVDIYRTYRNNDCQGNQVNINGMVFDRVNDEGQPTEYCTDFNDTTTQLTQGAVVPRLKGQYDQQFQLGYEQEVIEDLILGVRWLHRDLGRAVEDVSTDGGQNFIIANPGEEISSDDIRDQTRACEALEAELADLDSNDPGRTQLIRERERCRFLEEAFRRISERFDRPRRNYDAFTFQVKKRFAKNWILIASYTYNRLVGNYDGFVDPITGAVNLGASTQFDLPELIRNSYGQLSNSTPHLFRLNGFYSFDLREAGMLTLGTSVEVKSGFPISLRGGHSRYPGAYPVYVLPRGKGGRIEPNYRWNLSIEYVYPLPGDLELGIGARLFNITNAKAILRVDEIYTFQNTRAIAGGDLSDLKHAKVQNSSAPGEFFQRQIITPQGNFGVETAFQNPLAGQFDLFLRF